MILLVRKLEGETHGFAIEVEHGRAEEFLPLRQDLGGAGAGVGRRSVVEGGYFRKFVDDVGGGGACTGTLGIPTAAEKSGIFP